MVKIIFLIRLKLAQDDSKQLGQREEVLAKEAYCDPGDFSASIKR